MEVGQIIVTEHNGGRAEVKHVGEVTRGLFGLEFRVATLVALDDKQEPRGIRLGQEFTILKRVEYTVGEVQAGSAIARALADSDRPDQGPYGEVDVSDRQRHGRGPDGNH